MSVMDQSHAKPRSTARVLARGTVSKVPKAVSSPKHPQDEAHPTPSAAVSEGDGSSPLSAAPVHTVKNSTQFNDDIGLRTSNPEVSSVNSVSRPSGAKDIDIDSIIRSLDLIGSSITELNTANDTTGKTLTNLQTTHEQLRADIMKCGNAVIHVPTSLEARLVKDIKSRVNPSVSATAPLQSPPETFLTEINSPAFPKAEIHPPQSARLRKHGREIINSVYQWTGSKDRSETKRLFVSTWGETRTFYQGWQRRIREMLIEFDRSEKEMRERFSEMLGMIAYEELLRFEEGCLKEEKAADKMGKTAE